MMVMCRIIAIEDARDGVGRKDTDGYCTGSGCSYHGGGRPHHGPLLYTNLLACSPAAGGRQLLWWQSVESEMSPPGSRCNPQFPTWQWVAPSCTHPGLLFLCLILTLTFALMQGISQQQASSLNQPPSRPTSAHSPSSLIKVQSPCIYLLLSMRVILIENSCYRRGSRGWCVILKVPMLEGGRGR